MQKSRSLVSILLFCFCILSVLQCNFPAQPSAIQSSSQGVAKILIAVSQNSPFQLIARAAVCRISAPDMTTMVDSLTITSTSVEGDINRIPAGSNRFFEVSVYDSNHAVCYYGSAHADVVLDSAVMVSIVLYRSGGEAIINGTVSENPASDIPHPSAVDSGLVAYYPFNGNAADESDHGFNGIVRGATLTCDRFGQPNKAYYFNGNAGISSPVNTLLSLSTFTVAAWFKCGGPGTTIPRIVTVARPGECNCYYGLLQANGEWNGYFDTSRRLVGILNDPTSSYGYRLNYSQVSLDSLSWHHGAITFGNGVLRIYIDGKFDSEVSTPHASTQFPGSADLEIGFCSGGSNYVGSLDDIRIYSRILSDAEIMAVHSSPD
jgi:Concanavalin A-like lectin/glucanases superfamily